MNEPNENISARWAFLARNLVRHVDSRDRVIRHWLRDEYRREFQTALRPSYEEQGETARGVFQQRHTRWVARAVKAPTDLLSHDLAQFEKAGVVVRDGGWIRVTDWVALAAIASEDFTSLLVRSSSGEQPPPPHHPET